METTSFWRIHQQDRIFWKNLVRRKNVFIRLKEILFFVQQQMSENSKASPCVYTCDNPSKRKTFLLANVARLIKKDCSGTIVAFIQLLTFVADFDKADQNVAFFKYSDTFLLPTNMPNCYLS